MDNESVFFICVALVVCTALGCCTALDSKCAERGMRYGLDGCIQQPAAK